MNAKHTAAEQAAKVLLARGVNEGMDVRDYPCSDGCGPGPRFILRVAFRTAVCFNMKELRRELTKHRFKRGQDLIDVLVPFEPLPD